MKLSANSSCFFLLTGFPLRQVILAKLLSLLAGFACLSVLSIVACPGETGVVWAGDKDDSNKKGQLSNSQRLWKKKGKRVVTATPDFEKRPSDEAVNGADTVVKNNISETVVEGYANKTATIVKINTSETVIKEPLNNTAAVVKNNTSETVIEEPLNNTATVVENNTSETVVEEPASKTVAIAEKSDFTRNLLDNPKLFLLESSDQPVTFDSKESVIIASGKKNYFIFSNGLPVGWSVASSGGVKFTVKLVRSGKNFECTRISWKKHDIANNCLKIINQKFFCVDDVSTDNNKSFCSIFGACYRKNNSNIELILVTPDGREWDLFHGGLVSVVRSDTFDYIMIPSSNTFKKFRVGFKIHTLDSGSLDIIDTFLIQGKIDETQYDPLGAAYGKYAGKQKKCKFESLFQEFSTKTSLASFAQKFGVFTFPAAGNNKDITVFCINEETKKSYICTPFLPSCDSSDENKFQTVGEPLMDGKIKAVILPKWEPFREEAILSAF